MRLAEGDLNYIAITGSASLQDTHLLGTFGGTGIALKAGPRHLVSALARTPC